MGAWYTVWQGTAEGFVQQRRHDNAKRPEVRGEKRAFDTDQRVVKSVVIGVWVGGGAGSRGSSGGKICTILHVIIHI